MALSRAGQILAIEVKSGLGDFRVDRKWSGYRDYCDAFAFAVAPDFPEHVLPLDAGLILADSYGGYWARQPGAHVLSPARRKAMTISFACMAAGRLHAMDDPVIV